MRLDIIRGKYLVVVICFMLTLIFVFGFITSRDDEKKEATVISPELTAENRPKDELLCLLAPWLKRCPTHTYPQIPKRRSTCIEV